MFQHCPLLASFSVENHTRAFEEFLEYKTRVPVRGAIMLNQEMDSTVLVKGWKKGANWSFPRGKINKDEDDLDCAIREVWEETGLDLRAAGLAPKEAKPKYIEITMREQQMRLYIFRDIPMNTHFQPMTRKEISKIQWYKLSELPAFRKKGHQEAGGNATTSSANKFYMVAPFLVPLKKWVGQQKRTEARKAAIHSNHLNPYLPVDETHTEEDAWTQTIPDAPRETPAIETLEGATMELQRLLKVQPPTQGLQPAPAQESKASALLSILQKGRTTEAAQVSQPQHMAHAPLDMGPAELPQPQDSHQYLDQTNTSSNTTQPPLQAYLQQNQQAQGWNHGQGNQQTYSRPMSGGMPQQRQHSGQTQILHPQPLPPQVQKSIFTQSTPQPQAGTGNLQNAHPQQPRPGYAQHPHTLPQQSQMPPNIGRPVQLDDQSQALLNAFKTGPGHPIKAAPDALELLKAFKKGPDTMTNQQAQRASPGFGQASHQPQQMPQLPPLSQAQAQAQAQHNVARAGGDPPSDAHRSALLGMFKIGQRATPELSMGGARAPGVGASDTEKQLLDTLRGPSENIQAPQAPQAQRSQTQQHVDPSAALSDFLALKPKQEQATQSQHQYQQRPVEVPANPQRQPSVPSPAQQAQGHAQPIRILQRGQNPDTLSVGNLSIGNQGQHMPKYSPYSNQAMPALGTTPDRASLPSPASSGHHASGTQDQKRQLLSLFSKQQQQSPQPGSVPSEQSYRDHAQQKSRMAALASGAGAGEITFDRASPHHETQNPMSPADKSFLLDYLQSVTTNAKP